MLTYSTEIHLELVNILPVSNRNWPAPHISAPILKMPIGIRPPTKIQLYGKAVLVGLDFFVQR